MPPVTDPPAAEEPLFPPPLPGGDETPPAPPQTAPAPPADSSDLTKAILMLAEGQRRLGENQATLNETLRQLAVAQAQAAENTQWLRQHAEPYAQSAPIDVAFTAQNGDPPPTQNGGGAGKLMVGGIDVSGILPLILNNLLKGSIAPAASAVDGDLAAIQRLKATYTLLHDIFAPAEPNPDIVSMVQRDTAELFQRGYKLQIDVDKMAQAIIEGDDERRARRTRATTPPAPAVTP